MPRTSNSYKKISAQKRNETALQAAFNVKVPILFARVEACLGNAQFRLIVANGSTVNGTPLGLFTRATMPINPGQIVILEEAPKDKIHLIVGRIDDRKTAQKLVDLGRLPANLLGIEKDQEDAFEFETDANADPDEEVNIDAV